MLTPLVKVAVISPATKDGTCLISAGNIASAYQRPDGYYVVCVAGNEYVMVGSEYDLLVAWRSRAVENEQQREQGWRSRFYELLNMVAKIRR